MRCYACLPASVVGVLEVEDFKGTSGDTDITINSFRQTGWSAGN